MEEKDYGPVVLVPLVLPAVPIVPVVAAGGGDVVPVVTAVVAGGVVSPAVEVVALESVFVSELPQPAKIPAAIMPAAKSQMNFFMFFILFSRVELLNSRLCALS